ncbi:MAG TPA: peptidoglycan-binding protein [Leptolyngbyaceae cyanobacterium]
MSGLIRFCGFLLPFSLLIGYQLPPALSQGFSRLPSELSTQESVERPTLKVGSRGEAVSELQEALQKLGHYTGRVDGKFGESTQLAVSKFQQTVGLKDDGVVGPATWARLFPATPTEASSLPSASATAIESPATAVMTASATTATASEMAIDNLPVLKLGMRGPAVFWLQKRLESIGFFQGRVDGVFGSSTEIAVKAAQERYNLRSDGIVGPSTWRTILP